MRSAWRRTEMRRLVHFIPRGSSFLQRLVLRVSHTTGSPCCSRWWRWKSPQITGVVPDTRRQGRDCGQWGHCPDQEVGNWKWGRGVKDLSLPLGHHRIQQRYYDTIRKKKKGKEMIKNNPSGNNKNYCELHKEKHQTEMTMEICMHTPTIRWKPSTYSLLN